MRRIASLMLVAAFATLTTRAQTNVSTFAQPAPMQTAKQFKLKKSLTTDYLLFLPQGYNARERKTWPLILFLHGAGERGSDVSKVATHGPAKYIKAHPDFPFILVSPLCPAGRIWSNDTLLELLDGVSQEYSIDANRIYLTGLSMGGYGTWNLGPAYPEKFAAIAPICGGGEMLSLLLSHSDKPEALNSLGIWAFHGAKDPVVPLAETERMVDLAKKAGVQEVKLTIYPEAQHDSWSETYKNPELYQWLLAHARKQ
jgi:predicted peptidase